ncbi:MAG: C4-dicarboxylate ABC transporter, partial [Lachnospiraceae bacterium]
TYAREQSDERIADRVATIEESGTKIIILSDEVRNEIRENSQGVYDSIKENISEDIYNAYMRTE